MSLTIRTTGLEEYAPGGKARLKLMNIGGPGAGKTRMASFWPKPIWADCEDGLASVADRNMPYGTINTSDDMLDFLTFLATECKRPEEQRKYLTVVIDTLDAFQRKVKDEWLQKNPNAQSFRGFDAWGYLDSKMQMLLTRLLNLDMNVIVNVHYKDKVIREGTGESATERQELSLQLSGDVKDSAFNDFDLVGWMGTFWAAGEEGREERRGLTFRRTPEKPFLKDRLHFTPKWFEVTFTDNDYTGLFSLLQARLDEIREVAGQGGDVVDEIPTASDFRPTSAVGPDAARGGALAPQDPRDVPVSQYGKPELQSFARLLGIEFKGNTLKSELIDAITAKGGMAAVIKAREEGQAKAEAAAAAPAEPAVVTPAVVESGPVEVQVSSEAPTVSLDAVAAGVQPEVEDPECEAPSGYAGVPACSFDKGHAGDHQWVRKVAELSVAVTHLEEAKAANLAQAKALIAEAEAEAAAQVGADRDLAEAVTLVASEATPVETTQTEVGAVDTATGEVVEPAPTVEDVTAALGGTVVEEVVNLSAPREPAPVATPAPQSAAEGDGHNCGYTGCGKALGGTDENQDYVKLSRIKFLTRLCNQHFIECKKSGKSATQLRTDGVIA